jgi:type III pantothenate kinase
MSGAPASSTPIVAVDVGNSRVKFGLFDANVNALPSEPLPSPVRTLEIVPGEEAFAPIAGWLEGFSPSSVSWWIGSVQRSVSSRLIDWLRNQGATRLTLLASIDLPLRATLPRPDMVGIDRLLGAVAANRLRSGNKPAIIVDLGTAITVDLVSAAGEFLGGAILPGIGLSSRALHEFTDLLPLLDMHSLAEPPPALGTDTTSALTSGIYWGAIGGVRHLIELLGAPLANPPQVFLTGGAAPAVARLISQEAIYVPHLVLGGIALTAQGERG